MRTRCRYFLRLSIVPLLITVAALFGQGSGSAVDYSTIAPADIEAHIAEIQGFRSPFGGEAQRAKLGEVVEYVRDTLASYRLTVSEDPVTYSAQTFPNIVGTLRGTTCPEKTFIVSAHYDGVAGSPAADDDASGVAAVLEIARVLSAQPLQASVDFVAFSFEEQGLIGSSQMAVAARAADRPLVGMVNFDMIAYTCDVEGCQDYPEGIPPPRPTGDFAAIVGNTTSHDLLESFIAVAPSAAPDLITVPLEVPGNGETLPDVRRADHAPFWDRGYQALFVNDTANLRNPYYHQAGDTLDTLNLDFAADVANASLATVVDVLSADADGDGRADVCGPAPVGGDAESPQPKPSPDSDSDESSQPNAVVIAVMAAAGIAVVILVGAGLAVRRRSR